MESLSEELMSFQSFDEEESNEGNNLKILQRVQSDPKFRHNAYGLVPPSKGKPYKTMTNVTKPPTIKGSK